MSQSRTLFIGMDVHTDASAVASVAHDYGAEVISLGSIGTRLCAIDQRIRQMPSKATPLLFVSETGPCGSWLYRSRSTQEHDCWVVAPSRIPTKPGERVKTERRAAVPRARRARSSALTPVSVPKVAEEAIRDLTRAREDTISDLQDATCRLQACWLRQDIRYGGRAHGGPAHLRWRSAVVCPTPAQHIVLQEYGRAVHAHTERLQRLEQALQDHVNAWRLHPGVEARQALRGGQCTVAVTMVAAMGALTRCDTPRARRQCLGRIPSEYASGAQRRQGSLTQVGTTHARQAVVEGAWVSRSPAQGSRHRHLRREKHPKMI